MTTNKDGEGGRGGGNVERDKRQSETKVRVIFARPLIPRSTVPMDFECGISIVLHCSISPDMHFLRNGSDATPPLLFQSDQPGKFFSPFILHYSASRPIPPPPDVCFRVKFESMHRMRRPHRPVAYLQRTRLIRTIDKFSLSRYSSYRSISNDGNRTLFIFLFFPSSFSFFFFLLRFVTSR